MSPGLVRCGRCTGEQVQFRKIMIIGLEMIIESDCKRGDEGRLLGTLHCRFRSTRIDGGGDGGRTRERVFYWEIE